MACDMDQIDRIVRALKALRIPLIENEYTLHDMIAAVLRDGGFCVCHEARLAPRCRIDFLVGGVGIEVKRGKQDRKKLRAQCEKYLACDALDALIVVLDGAVMLPDTLCGKPVRVIGLNKLWGVALP